MLGLDNMAALGAGISYHHKFCMEWMLHRDPNKRTAFDEGRVVAPGKTADLSFDLPQRVGPYQLFLGTEMSQTATTNGFAWAQWTHPCLE